MPKKTSVAGSEFICHDVLEYPGEHDDIMIGFDTEAGMFVCLPQQGVLTNGLLEREQFGAALPASMGKASRLAAFKK